MTTPRSLKPAEVFVSPLDVILAPHDVVQPDLVVVASPAQVSSRGIEGPPLLAEPMTLLTNDAVLVRYGPLVQLV